MKKIILSVSVVLLVIILTACSIDKRTGEKVKITQTVTVTVGTNDLGEKITEKKEVESEMFVNPERVVSFSYGVSDMLYYANFFDAGIKEFAIAKGSSLPEMLDQFNSDIYPNAGTLFEENRDVLDLINPDLIILDGRSASLYTDLVKAYPNADVLDVSNTNFSFDKQKEVVEILGKLFPRVKDKLDSKISELEEKLNLIGKETNNFKALFLMSNGDKLSVSGKDGRYGSLHKEFGFSEADPDGKVGDAHGNNISKEYLTELDSKNSLDVLFIMDRAAVVSGVETGLENLLNDPQFKALNAVKNNRFYILNPEAWYLVTGGFTSTETMINDILQFVNDLKK